MHCELILPHLDHMQYNWTLVIVQGENSSPLIVIADLLWLDGTYTCGLVPPTPPIVPFLSSLFVYHFIPSETYRVGYFLYQYNN